MTACDRIEEVRDYAMGELAPEAREAVERHIPGCEECTAEIAVLQLTTAALRSLPDREVPQRIAFVSDKVFEASPVSRFFSGFWNSAARLGFASACVLAGAMVFWTVNRPQQPVAGPAAPVIQASITQADVEAAVNKAVAKVHEDDERVTTAALASADGRHEREHRALMVAMEENMTVLQKRLSTYTMLASADDFRAGGVR